MRVESVEVWGAESLRWKRTPEEHKRRPHCGTVKRTNPLFEFRHSVPQPYELSGVVQRLHSQSLNTDIHTDGSMYVSIWYDISQRDELHTNCYNLKINETKVLITMFGKKYEEFRNLFSSSGISMSKSGSMRWPGHAAYMEDKLQPTFCRKSAKMPLVILRRSGVNTKMDPKQNRGRVNCTHVAQERTLNAQRAIAIW